MSTGCLRGEGLPAPTVISIDGPVAAGKTAVGRLLSRRLGYRLIDTGSMYRAVAWLALERRIDPSDEDALKRLAELTPVDITQRDGREVVIIAGEDVSDRLRTPEVEQVVSLVARVPGVRKALVEQQRRIAAGGRIVMVGRDIGTVVLPDAGLKLFLLASPGERARRRYLELEQSGQQVNQQKVLDDLLARDKLDSERADSPLRPAEDALKLDTDDLSLERVVARILALIRED